MTTHPTEANIFDAKLFRAEWSVVLPPKICYDDNACEDLVRKYSSCREMFAQVVWRVRTVIGGMGFPPYFACIPPDGPRWVSCPKSSYFQLIRLSVFIFGLRYQFQDGWEDGEDDLRDFIQSQLCEASAEVLSFIHSSMSRRILRNLQLHEILSLAYYIAFVLALVTVSYVECYRVDTSPKFFDYLNDLSEYLFCQFLTLYDRIPSSDSAELTRGWKSGAKQLYFLEWLQEELEDRTYGLDMEL